MQGTIGVKDLRVICIIGVHPRERELPQMLMVDAEADLDFGPAAESDDVAATVDYAQIAARIQTLAQESRFQLIEAFAEEAAALILREWPSISATRIEIKKPSALPGAGHSFARVERRR